mmetsp:Transcript_42973/g.130794  ORF Transcript_42973/g.130794 Transcript_42973/m.130794 type:complete len:307 (-) Transcript_42973:107-1027(-)
MSVLPEILSVLGRAVTRELTPGARRQFGRVRGGRGAGAGAGAAGGGRNAPDGAGGLRGRAQSGEGEVVHGGGREGEGGAGILGVPVPPRIGSHGHPSAGCCFVVAVGILPHRHLVPNDVRNLLQLTVVTPASTTVVRPPRTGQVRVDQRGNVGRDAVPVSAQCQGADRAFLMGGEGGMGSRGPRCVPRPYKEEEGEIVPGREGISGEGIFLLVQTPIPRFLIVPMIGILTDVIEQHRIVRPQWQSRPYQKISVAASGNVRVDQIPYKEGSYDVAYVVGGWGIENGGGEGERAVVIVVPSPLPRRRW